MNRQHNNGYVTVVSALIVTSLAVVIASSLSMSNFLGRFNTQFIEMKKISRDITWGCLEHAKLKMAKGGYEGEENIKIGGYTCHIYEIKEKGGSKIIKASSTVESKNTSLKISVDSKTLETNYIQEVVSF